MLLFSSRFKFVSRLIVAAAMLQCSVHCFATEPQTAASPPTRQRQSGLEKQMLSSLPPPSAKLSSDEPFGRMMTITIASGDVSDKWRLVRTEVDAEAAVLDHCRAQQECPAAARGFLDIVAQGQGRNGLARIGLINRAVNPAIRPTSDMKQWGVTDHWSPPLETLTTARGECEDYAIAKYVALIDAGLREEDVKLVIVRNRFPDAEHAVVAARADGRWFVLDNRSLALVPDDDFRSVTPLFLLDQASTRAFAFGTGGGLS